MRICGQIVKYLRYSGALITLIVNPLYWKIYPWVKKTHDFYDKPRYEFKFLCILIVVWFDNGEW